MPTYLLRDSTSAISDGPSGSRRDQNGAQQRTSSASRPSASQVRLPPLQNGLATSRLSSSAHNITTAYPSVSEDYIGSHYYGRYDDKTLDNIGLQRSPTSNASASACVWASPARDQLAHRDEATAYSSITQALPAHINLDETQGSADLESWRQRMYPSLDDAIVSEPQDLILASPEELQRSDRFSHAGSICTHFGPGKRRETGSSLQSPPSLAMVGTSHWNTGELESSSALDLGVVHAPDSELTGLRSGATRLSGHGAPPGKTTVGFMTTLPDDLEENPVNDVQQHIQRSSGEIIADASGDNSGVRQAREGLNRLRKSIRRVSRRVVDMNSSDADDARRLTVSHIRLADDDDTDADSLDEDEVEIQPAAASHAQQSPVIWNARSTKQSPFNLRGKILGFLGPENRFRRAMASVLAFWWVEPLILTVIIANLVIVVIQTGRDVNEIPGKPSFFRSWENIALLAIFSIYTIEMMARIVVSGLIINPPRLEVYDPLVRLKSSPNDSSDRSIVSNHTEQLLLKSGALKSHRRDMSRSNTLDAWSELGGTLKSRAQHALNPDILRHQTDARRKSTIQFTSASSSSDRQYHSRTVGTKPSAGITSGPPLLDAINHSVIKESYQSTPLQSPPCPSPSTNGKMTKDSSKIVRTMQEKAVPFASAIAVQRSHVSDYAYLRHSWNRVDFFAVICFWVSFFLAISNQEMGPTRHIYVFRALSTLRCARLLTVTSGTSTILQSLKLAAPLLWNVLFFTLFAMILFSIIGIQSFKGSYRRSCVWVGDANKGIDAEPGQNHTLSQICGGWMDANGERHPHYTVGGVPSPIRAKGYICPVGQVCQEANSNPNKDTQSFDNILTSFLEVVIVISSNGWSGIMYDMIDADYFVASLFFVLGIIFLNFWLANLFVAVITNSFATISSQTHQSAFSKQNIDETIGAALQKPEADTVARRRRKKAANVYKRVWGYTHFVWLGAIIASLSIQASGAAYDTDAASTFVSSAEMYFTFAFDIEIVLRFLSYALDDDWRSFFNGHHGGRNKVDLGLCVITSVIQIPAIKHSNVYPWLTIFQLQRFYRVIVAAPRMERLLLRVFGSLSGLLNMILFLLMIVGLAALVAVQMLRGDIESTDGGEDVEMTFKNLFNTFLAMYQIFSSENWNDILFLVVSSVKQYQNAVISGIFVAGWFLFANFIVLQMFIAVINEGFSFTEAERRRQQLDHYLKRLDPPPTSATGKLLHKLSPYRWLKARNAAILNQSISDSVDSHTEAIARSLDGDSGRRTRIREMRRGHHNSFKSTCLQALEVAEDVASTAKRLLRLDTPEDASVPLDTVRQREIRHSFHSNDMLQNRLSERHPSIYDVGPVDEDEAARVFARERQLHRMRSNLGLLSEKPTQQQIDNAHIARYEENPQLTMAMAINEHPSFDTTLWIFSNHNKFRRFCQSIVPSSYGHRIFGRQHSPRRFLVTQIVIFVTIVASVVVAGIASPLYRKDWYARNGFRRDSWFSMAEVFLSLVFFVEFFVKIVADGIAFTPNAYLLSPWNLLDLLVLATLVVNVSTELAVIGGGSRFTRALKAFRALRLINLSARMRTTFENLIIGGGRFVDAAILAILYIIPFAVWGQNLFSGLLYGCTDESDGISTKADCVGEYSASPSDWTFLAPRVWSNPTSGSSYSFDDFKSALLILFEIVSLEGWIDVMTSAMAIVGLHQQPSVDSRQVNALFFVIYNLIGAVLVLTLFVSVIIEGFQSATGAAFLSTEQRQWIDLKRMIARQKPSKRPIAPPTSPICRWCHTRATRKHDWWGRLLTVSYVVNLTTLCTQSYHQHPSSEHIRDVIYFVLALLYASDVAVRFLGLGWTSFRRSWWCIFDSIVVVGIFANTIPLLLSEIPVQSNIQLQKLFLTAATLKLVSKHNGLNQLFKTAISGLPAIISLLGLWLCLFFFYAIMFVEIFGLTKWGYIGPESYSKNFSSLPLTLIFLSMMTTGEGWNAYMHDYTVEPPSCTPSANYLETDCGSTSWAYFLFIGWNVTSMYVFLNMFTGTVVENFSYIFQLGGKPVLSREDMRGFKRTWLQIAGTSAQMPQDKFALFFSSLPGKFELKVYPEKLHIRVLREALTGDKRASTASLSSSHRPGVAGAMSRIRGSSPISSCPSASHFAPWAAASSKSLLRVSSTPGELNLARLQSILDCVTKEETRLRRERYNRIWHEANILAEPEGRISFHDLLTLVAHYKLVDDDVALAPQELLERRAMNEQIDDRIKLERVREVMRMTYLRHRFNTLKAERQRVEVEMSLAGISSDRHATTKSVPIIKVDGVESPPLSLDFGSQDSPSRRPKLKLDVAAAKTAEASSSLPGEGLNTPPDQSGAPSLHSADHLAPASSPSARAPIGRGAEQLVAADSASNSNGYCPSLKELEKRASPLLEQFDDSAWGKFMRRVSVGAAAGGENGSSTSNERSHITMLAESGHARQGDWLDNSGPRTSSSLSISSALQEKPWMRNTSSAKRIVSAGRRDSNFGTASHEPLSLVISATPGAASGAAAERSLGSPTNPLYSLDSDDAWTSMKAARTTATSPSPLSSPTKRHQRQGSSRDTDEGSNLDP